MKYKTNSGSKKDIGMFDKLFKYSMVQFLRKPTGRKLDQSANPSQTLSASYDMTGRESDDHKPEIGAPILISKTSIEHDAIHHDSAHSDVFVDAQGSAEIDSSFKETKISYYSTDAKTALQPKDLKYSRSKSASNLQKAELNLYLVRTSSIENGMTHNDGVRFVDKHNADKRLIPISTIHNKCSESELDANEGFHRSRESVTVNSSIFDGDQVVGFDLKSASFQSLDARNIFLSIEELNDITAQINGIDEFKSTDETHSEYCAHRDNLPPSARCITFLRNKSHPKLFSTKKEKLTNAWSDFKSWIDAAAHKVGANKSGDLTSLTTTNEPTSGNIVRNAEFFNRIQSNGNGTDDGKANCSNTDAGDHVDNTMSCDGNRCIDESGTDTHENHTNSLLSSASMITKEKNLQDSLAEVKC